MRHGSVGQFVGVLGASVSGVEFSRFRRAFDTPFDIVYEAQP